LQKLKELTNSKTIEIGIDTLVRWKELLCNVLHDPKETGLDKLITIAGLKTKIISIRDSGFIGK